MSRTWVNLLEAVACPALFKEHSSNSLALLWPKSPWTMPTQAKENCPVWLQPPVKKPWTLWIHWMGLTNFSFGDLGHLDQEGPRAAGAGTPFSFLWNSSGTPYRAGGYIFIPVSYQHLICHGMKKAFVQTFLYMLISYKGSCALKYAARKILPKSKKMRLASI